MSARASATVAPCLGHAGRAIGLLLLDVPDERLGYPTQFRRLAVVGLREEPSDGLSAGDGE